MAVLINQENVTGQLNLDASASLLQDLDEYSVLVEWVPQATTGIDTLWGHAANAANNYGVSLQVTDNGNSTYNFRATLKGDTDLTAGETPASETTPTITVPTAAVIRATALFRSAGNYEIYANGLSDTQAINPVIEPLSNYNLDTVRINSINGSTSFAGTTAKLYVIDRIIDAGEIAAWESSATVPDLSSGPTISSISNFRAGETATITVDSYDTVGSVTADGSAQADAVEATATTITFTVDSDGFLPGSDVDVVVTDANGASNAYSVAYGLPTGFTGATVTSIGSGAISGVAIGDHIATNGGKYVAQADGSISVSGSPTNGDTYTILLYDASASYTRFDTDITVESEQITISGNTSSNVVENSGFSELVTIVNGSSPALTTNGGGVFTLTNVSGNSWTLTGTAPSFGSSNAYVAVITDNGVTFTHTMTVIDVNEALTPTAPNVVVDFPDNSALNTTNAVIATLAPTNYDSISLNMLGFNLDGLSLRINGALIFDTYVGTYTVTADDPDPTSVLTRTATGNITVIITEGDQTAPVITISGYSNGATISLTAGDYFEPPSATAVDNIDGAVSVNTVSTVNPGAPGTYGVTYSAVDAAGNPSFASLIVVVSAAENGGLSGPLRPILKPLLKSILQPVIR